MKKKILVIDDEPNIVKAVKRLLEEENFSVISAYRGKEGIELAEKEMPNLIILDVIMPEMDGRETLKAIRRNPKLKSLPIIMLTGKQKEMDVILGLEIGADDYITKPFAPGVLLARINAILRRITNQKEKKEEEIIKKGDLVIDSTLREIKYKNKKIETTFTEFNLLKVLAKNSNRVMSRNELLDKVWGEDYVGDGRVLDVYIRFLRRKLKEVGCKEELIETIRNIGHKFSDKH